MNPRAISPLMRRVALREWCAMLLAMLLLAIGLGAYNGLGRVDQTLYDQFVSHQGRPAPDDVIIVAIDDLSLAQLGRWPWPRALHAQLLERINVAQPRAVGLDVILTEPERTPVDPRKSGDVQLRGTLQQNGVTVLPLIMTNLGTGLVSLPPIDELAHAAAALGHINLQHDSDGVVRSVFLHEGIDGRWWPHFALALAIPRTTHTQPIAAPDVNDTTRGRWQRANQLHIPYAGSNGHFQSVPYVSVLRGEVPAQFFHDKYVLIGATALGMADAYPTPVSGTSGAMPGIEIHAHILASILDNKSISPAQPWQTALFGAVPALLAMMAYLLLAPRVALAACAALCVITLIASYIALRAGLWIAPAAALITLVLSYPLWSWRRLEAAIAYLGQEFTRLDREPHLLPEAPESGDSDQLEDVLERRINAMKTAARRVRDLRQFVSDSLDSLPDATLITATDGRILLANRHAHAYFAASSLVELAGMSLTDTLSILKAPQTVDQAINQPFGWKDILDLQLHAALANGVSVNNERGHDLLVKSAPCYAASNTLTGWIVSIIDISTIRAAERSRDETLRFLSHDMRAPQASILALLELQCDPASAIPQSELFARIEKASRKTLGLADDFVQLARAESHEYRREEVDLQDLLFDATDEMWTLAKNKNIQLVTDIPATEFPVNIDRTLITRALINLLSNAINYSPENTTVTCTLRRSLGMPPGHVFCSITDQGYGIAPADQAKLFRRFQRLDVPNQPRHDGIGLGLAFVKTVIERHDGRLTFSSEVGAGTTFTIELPGLASNPT